jgi:hypothetical protein
MPQRYHSRDLTNLLNLMEYFDLQETICGPKSYYPGFLKLVVF